MTIARSQPARTGSDLAGSDPVFPGLPGATLQTSLRLPGFQQKRLIFNRLGQPGQVHVYSAECRGGDLIRMQMLVPVLPLGGSVVPAFAVVAQSLPYKADIQKLPFTLPAGFSAVVAPPPTELVSPVKDALTRAHYYPGPTIDTRTLVGGRVYLVVWSPHNHMGKYVIQTGTRWPLRWTYWTRVPAIWWRIRGWFGLSRAAAVAALGATALGILLLISLLGRRGRA
ncbi:MAG: hypothetical protein KDD77_03605 [Caldilineaceae bacterium]|nr:hypothetical protein [Caldilineaceae bacterium]